MFQGDKNEGGNLNFIHCMVNEEEKSVLEPFFGICLSSNTTMRPDLEYVSRSSIRHKQIENCGC